MEEGQAEAREPLNKPVAWGFIPTRRSCLRRNDGVRDLVVNTLFRESLILGCRCRPWSLSPP